MSKARFVGVMRAIYGIEEEVGFKSKLSHDEIDLCRRLETMQYTYELSDGNVLMLNWRLLLFSLRSVLYCYISRSLTYFEQSL